MTMANEPKVSAARRAAESLWRETGGALTVDRFETIVSVACSQTVVPISNRERAERILDVILPDPFRTSPPEVIEDTLRDIERLLAAPPAVSTPFQVAQHAKFDMETLDAIRMRAEEGHPIHWSDFLYVLHGLKRAASAPRCPKCGSVCIGMNVGLNAFAAYCKMCGHDWTGEHFQPVSQPSPEVKP